MSNEHSAYYDKDAVARRVSTNQHRDFIGGMWDEIGPLQMDFLKSRGLEPSHTLLDIGCGSLRLGVRAVAHFDAGNYWGTDLNEPLLDAGFDKEIVPAGLAGKLSRDHLVTDADFAFPGVPRTFDFAIAQSVFTHFPLNHLRLCLANLAAHLDGPCSFYATVFHAPADSVTKPFQQARGGTVSQPHKDPYHYSVEDLNYAAKDLPWDVNFVGEWNHPRSQQMVHFRKPA